MKHIAKSSMLALLMLLLAAQSMLTVQAKSKNKKPDPSFKEKATHIEQSHKPYYGNSAIVDIYELDGIYYSVDVITEDVVEIIPDIINYETAPTYTQDQLQNTAESIVSQFLGSKVDLHQMALTIGQKTGTFFFRWEDPIKKLEDSTIAFVQVGLSQNGDFLNLINTLPFGYGKLKVHARLATTNPNLIGPFNQIYANGGSYWQPTSWSGSSATGGYYYLNPSGCTGSFCSKFYYSSGNKAGGWYPNKSGNTNTKASVFIPSTHAIGTVTYQVKDVNSVGVVNTSVNQNSWYNTWVSITPSTSSNGIGGINMQNTSASEVAWDEAWVYNP